MQVKSIPKTHTAILSTFIKLPVVFKTFVLFIVKWPLMTGFTAMYNTVKPVLSGYSKRRQKFVLKDRFWLNAGQKYCRILSTFIKLPAVFNTCVLFIFEWSLTPTRNNVCYRVCDLYRRSLLPHYARKPVFGISH